MIISYFEIIFQITLTFIPLIAASKNMIIFSQNFNIDKINIQKNNKIFFTNLGVS